MVGEDEGGGGVLKEEEESQEGKLAEERPVASTGMWREERSESGVDGNYSRSLAIPPRQRSPFGSNRRPSKSGLL